MARLEWKNVAAPSFAGIADNYRTMSDLLGRAAGSTKGMFDIFANAQQGAADRAIIQRMLGVQDVGAYDPASIIGADGANASTAALLGVGRHKDTLIDRQGTLLGQQVTRDNHNWTQGAREQTLQYGEPMRRALAAAAAGDTTALSGDAFAGMRADVYNSFLRDGLSNATTDMSLRTSQQRLDESIYDFDKLKLDDDTRRQANAVLHDLWTNSYDGASALARFGELTKGMEPRVVQALRGQLASIYPAQFGFSPSASGIPSAGGGGGAALPVLAQMTGAGGAKGLALPDNIRTIGDLVDNKSNLIRYNGGHTATGMYQINADTWADFAPKALGAGWRDADVRDPHVQDQVAKAIWDSAKGSAERISARWASIPRSQAQSLVGRSWEEVRDVVSQGETNSRASQLLSASATPLQVSNSIRDVVRADDMANSAGVSERLAANMGRRRAPHVVAKEIAASFPDTSETDLQRGITNLMAELQITADQAAELMLQNRPAMERSRINPASWRWLGGNRFDVDTDISGAGGRNAVGSMLQTAAANQSRAEVVQLTQQLASQIASIDQQIDLVRQRINALGEQPGLVRSLQELLMQRQQLIGTQQTLGSIQRGTQDFTSDDLALLAQLKEQEDLQKLIEGGLFWRMPKSREATQRERTQRMIQALERAKL